MTRSQRKTYFHIWVPLGLTWLIVILLLIGMLWPYKYLTFGDYYVDNEMYRPGEFVTVTISEFCTNGTANSNERWLDNSFGGVGLPPLRFVGTGEPMCIKDLQFKVQIPMETVPGQYRLEFVTQYQPNPIRTVQIKTYTPYFQVIK